jgi:hypothetical protein
MVFSQLETPNNITEQEQKGQTWAFNESRPLG